MGLDQTRPETRTTLGFYAPKGNKFPFLPLFKAILVGSSITAYPKNSALPNPGILLRVDGTSSISAWEVLLIDALLVQTETVQEPSYGK